MSWSLLVSPLHRIAADGGLEWAASASTTYGVPSEPPAAQELPTVAQVLAAVRETGCHGTAWFRLSDRDPSTGLTECPDPVTCASTGGADLGEVSLQSDEADEGPLRSGSTVNAVGFRKPSPEAVLAVVSALAHRAGPLLVCDTVGDTVVVVSPGDDPQRMAANWPW